MKKTPLILGHEIIGIVDRIGKKVQSFKPGDRAEVAWLNHACERCKFCLSNKGNLCPQATFTFWDTDGGYAEYTILDGNFAFHLEENLSFREIR